MLSLIGKLWPVVWPTVVVLGSAVWTVYVYKRADKKQTIREDATLIKVAQDAASGVIGELRTELNRQKKENDALRGRVETLEGELSSVRKTHIDMVEAKDATILMLRSELSAARAENEALRRQMVKGGMTPPPRADAHMELTAAGKLRPATEPLP